MFTCPKCLKCFEIKQQYQRHINQRTDCAAILKVLEYIPTFNKFIACRFCHKHFEKTRELLRHQESKNTLCFLTNLKK